MSQSRAASLFPLPLTPFERYMLCDDRPDYPMTFALRLKFAGQMRRADLDAAFAETLAAHPLLLAKVRSFARWGLAWTLAETGRPAIDWGTSGEAIGSPVGERIDLNDEVGLRAWCRTDADTAEVTLQFHHACCDGGGSLAFTKHLLAAYGARTAEDDMLPTLRPPNPNALLNRWRFDFTPPAERPNRLRMLGNGLRDGWRWLRRRPAPLCSRRPASVADESSQPFLEMLFHTFHVEASRRLRQAASGRGLTLGDLLLGDLFVSLCQWNLAQDDRAADRWLRIAVPVKLQSIDRSEPSAANAMSFNFITRRESQCADRDSLLEGIHLENGLATRLRRTKLFVRGLSLMSLVPGAIERMVGSRRCWSTAVLSNIGDINRMFPDIPQRNDRLIVGNLVLEEIYGAPPVRPLTSAAFAAGTYAGRLWISLRRDPHALSADDAQHLLDIYVKHLEDSAAGVG